MQYISLFIASFGFMALHFVSASNIRAKVITKFGEIAWLSLFSILSLVFFIWMVVEYIAAERVEDLWQMPLWWLWVNAALMFISLTLILLGYISKNPAIGESNLTKHALKGKHLGKGIFAITRHPAMWGVAILSAAHMLTNGSIEAQMFFGSLLGTAVIGSYLQDKRKARNHGEEWAQYATKTSWLPFKALLSGRAKFRISDLKWWQIGLAIILWAGLLELHRGYYGAYVLPL
ncbi:MAG: hypothetical protein HRU28_07400 [Rhizobiales bacterium]|nr:hypothetical protein [Hyphomicrobiales bacterium]